MLDDHGEKVLVLESVLNVFYLRINLLSVEKKSESAATVITECQKSMLEIRHQRMGHLNKWTLKKNAKEGIKAGIKVEGAKDLQTCKVCSAGKSTRTLFPKEQKGTLKYCNLWTSKFADLFG